MKKAPMLAAASLSTLLAVAMTAPAYAWHPVGTITKQVQNQTAGGSAVDANDTASAISAAPGDTLVYTITVGNNGDAAANGNNDMAGTQLTDTLPAGIELVSNPSQRTITADLGTIAPGKNVVKTYGVKVTDSTDGDVITNKACFEGNSKISDNKQSGCDVAIVTVKVPTTPTQPTTPVDTTPSAPADTSANLPNTGSTGLTAALVVMGTATLGYILNTLRLQRRG